MNNYQNGHLAEYMAMWFLRFRGYRLLFQNYRCGRGTHAGEVDLIMLKKKTVVFIEVKQRQTLEKAAYAVLPPQKSGFAVPPRLSFPATLNIWTMAYVLTRCWFPFRSKSFIFRTRLIRPDVLT